MGKPLHFDVHGQLCLLAMDDDQINLMVVEQLLAPQGWKVVTAINGEDAMEALEEDTWPDIVFLDYHMGLGESGDEICRKMKAVFGDVNIPIVMCTALSAGSKGLRMANEAGSVDVLLKPYDRIRMLDVVAKHVGPLKAKAHSANTPPAGAPASSSSQSPPTAADTSSHSSDSGGPLSSSFAPASKPSPSATAGRGDVEALCVGLDLEYCGRKLASGGVTLAALKAMDDTALRKAGVVIKAQRDKIREAVQLLP
ncbi:MAG: hypothetical protein WDW38_009680 [Sanguina aurantia]